MSYQATIARLYTRPHPNADRLLVGVAMGAQVIVGKDTEDGQLGAYFPPDGQLSLEMCEANGLLKKDGGYFDDNRRVRSQKFRGVKSEGFWVPLSYLAWTGVDVEALAEHDAFTVLGGKLVCEKYYTRATRERMATMGRKAKTKRGETPYLRKHPDTAQLRQVIGLIPEGSLLYFSEKLHGTSGRYANVLDDLPQPWYRRLLRLPTRQAHDLLVGSRNVILTHTPNGGWYEDESFRHNVIKAVSLKAGEVLFGEIVGYANVRSPLMGVQAVKDNELAKIYGRHMEYRYGQLDGTCQLYVYHIQRVAENGDMIDLTWPQVVGRCREISLPVPPALCPPMIFSSADTLMEHVDGLLEGPSTLDSSHIREGVVVRIEEPHGRIWWAKMKSFTFGVLEGYVKDSESYVDLEEVS